MKTDTYTPTKIETWPVREYEAVKVWRETEERQCREKFTDEGAYCALGVLSGVPNSLAALGAMRRCGIPEINNGPKLSCPKCDEWRRLGFEMVTHWNDDHRYTFKEIADLAEAYPHLVFTEAQS